MDSRNIFWSKYSFLTKGKSKGGMGFRDLKSANEALLTKQFWRIVTEENTVVSRVMRAKYFTHIGEYPSLGYRPSYVWRSIWQSGRQLWKFMSMNDHGHRQWLLENNGLFSTNTAYAKIKEVKEAEINNIVGETSDNTSIERMWKTVWKLKVQGKVKIFFWKLYHGFLPLAVNLRSRGCNVQEQCKICDHPSENEFHVFFNCWWTKAYWLAAGIDHTQICSLGVSIKDWFYYIVRRFTMNQLIEVILGLRNIWFNRNQVYHDKPMLNPHEMASKAKLDSEKFSSHEFKFVVTELSGDISWLAPSGEFLKLNCDASFCKQFSLAGLACVVRDKDILFQGVHTWRVHNMNSSIDAEGLAILYAMEWAKRRRWFRCVFETDCATVFDSILQCRNISVAGDSWILKCAQFMAKEKEWHISLISREGNTVADFLARKTLAENWCWTDEDSLPRL